MLKNLGRRAFQFSALPDAGSLNAPPPALSVNSAFQLSFLKSFDPIAQLTSLPSDFFAPSSAAALPIKFTRQSTAALPALTRVAAVLVKNPSITSGATPSEALKAEIVAAIAATAVPTVDEKATLGQLVARWQNSAADAAWYGDVLDLIDAGLARGSFDATLIGDADPKLSRIAPPLPIDLGFASSALQGLADYWRSQIATAIALPAASSARRPYKFNLDAEAVNGDPLAKLEDLGGAELGLTLTALDSGVDQPSLPITDILANSIVPESWQVKGHCEKVNGKMQCPLASPDGHASVALTDPEGVAPEGLPLIANATVTLIEFGGGAGSTTVTRRFSLRCFQASFPSAAGIDCSPFDVAKLDAAIDAFAASAAGVTLFNDEIYREDQIWNGVATQLGVSAPAPCCDKAVDPGAPTDPDPGAVLQTLITQKNLGYILQYCQDCHTGAGNDPFEFVGGTTQKAFCESVAMQKDKIVQYVTEKNMPPPHSHQAQQMPDAARLSIASGLSGDSICAGL